MNNEYQGYAIEAGKPEPPKTWLWEAAAVTLLLFQPFGVVAIVNGVRTITYFQNGKTEAAETASRRARKWTLWGFWLGVLMVLLFTLLANT